MATFDQLFDAAGFDAQQRPSAQLIVDKFRAAGLSSGIALAAVVNAWAESQLDPIVCWGRTPWGADRAFGPIPDGENSCGLFMLNNAPGAAGDGYSLEFRQDPSKNIARIIEIVKGPDGASLRAASNDDAPLGRLIYLFTTDIEKPEYADQKGNERSDTARQWWPDLVDVASSNLPQFRSPSTFFLLGLAAVLVAVVVYSR